MSRNSNSIKKKHALYLYMLPNSQPIMDAVTEEEVVYLLLETGCPCQQANSYLPVLDARLTLALDSTLTHITMWLNWRAFFS